MLEYLKDFLYDKTTFAGVVRSSLFALGTLPEVIDFGAAGTEAWYVGKALQALSLLVRSSQK